MLFKLGERVNMRVAVRQTEGQRPLVHIKLNLIQQHLDARHDVV